MVSETVKSTKRKNFQKKEHLLIGASGPVLAVLAEVRGWHTAEQVEDEPGLDVDFGDLLPIGNQPTLLVDWCVESNHDVDEKEAIEEQIVVDVAPFFRSSHKDEPEGNQERDEDLIEQDNRRVGKVNLAKSWEEPPGGHRHL